jgi:NAD(P)-dependent dehydrogenase (short-subunit alcohol dehydrogenase family)
MKNALVWGAGGGIGRALTEQLAGDGWNVIAVTHRPTNHFSPPVQLLDANVADPYEVQLAVNSASQLADGIDLWIYAAGDIASAKNTELTPDAWQRILDANLTGAFLTTHYSLPLLAPDAHLIYLGAISERLRLPGLGAYAAAKAGLEAFAEALGKEERKRRVTMVRPGAVDTPFWGKVPLRLPANALKPEVLARQIIEAYVQGHKGTLDIA